MLQKYRVLQLAETENERVLKLAMTEIQQVETDVFQAVLLKLEQSEMEELHQHLMYAIFALQVFNQTQAALFVSNIEETSREQVQRLVMTVTQTMEMDAVLYELSGQTLFEVEDQYHLQIRVQHALQIIKNMDREHTTQRMETSVQANGMVITKGNEKLTTRTELNISGKLEIAILESSKEAD